MTGERRKWSDTCSSGSVGVPKERGLTGRQESVSLLHLRSDTTCGNRLSLFDANSPARTGQGGALIRTTRRGATVAGPIPERIMRAGLAGGVPRQGTFLRIADLRSQPAYISVVVCRSTMPCRVVPTRPPGHHQTRSHTRPLSCIKEPGAAVWPPRGGRCGPG